MMPFLRVGPSDWTHRKFRHTSQSRFLSILNSMERRPLHFWDRKICNGYIKLKTDNEIDYPVLEVVSIKGYTYITCPPNPQQFLGIELPVMSIIMKNLKKNFTLEFEILDNLNMSRLFRASTFHRRTQVNQFLCTMPLLLDEGWNKIQLNLEDYTKRAYGTQYISTLRVQIHANCCIRSVFFSDRVYSEEELPEDFKLWIPVNYWPGE